MTRLCKVNFISCILGRGNYSYFGYYIYLQYNAKNKKNYNVLFLGGYSGYSGYKSNFHLILEKIVVTNLLGFCNHCNHSEQKNLPLK